MKMYTLNKKKINKLKWPVPISRYSPHNHMDELRKTTKCHKLYKAFFARIQTQYLPDSSRLV